MSTEKSKKRSRGWVGFDFDKTIAVRNSGDSIFKLGQPIPKTIEAIKKLLAEGRKVKVLTARNESQFPLIVTWLAKEGIAGVECTNKKDSRMDLLYDDRAVGVLENNGTSHAHIINALLSIVSRTADEDMFSLEEREWINTAEKAVMQFERER